MRKYPVYLMVLIVCAGLPAQSLDREAFLDAEISFLGGNYPLALERYDEFIREWPASSHAADARYRRAISLYRLNRPDEAYQALETVERRYRSTKYLAYIPFWKGVIEYERRDFAAAADRFGRLAENPPDPEIRSQALLYAGKAAAAQDQCEKALNRLEQYLNSLDERGLPLEQDASALLLMADMYTRLGNPRGLTGLWERIDAGRIGLPAREQLALRSAEAYLAAGDTGIAAAMFGELENSPRRNIAAAALSRLLEYEQGRNNEASVTAIIAKAENVLRADPEALGEFWLRVGANAFNKGRYDLAESYFLRISSIRGPENLPQEVPVYLAEIAFREGDASGAYRILAEAEPALRGDRALLVLRLGWYALALGDWDEGGRQLSRAMDLARSEGQEELARLAADYRSYALYRSGAAGEALSLLESERVPGQEHTFRGLLSAELSKALDRPEAALDQYNAVISADPRSPEAHLGRMALFLQKGQYARILEAASEMERYISLASLTDDRRFSFNYMKGIASAVLGNYMEAVSCLDDALSRGSGGGDALPWAEYYRGWSLYRLSRFEEASAALEAFARGHAAHPQAYSAAYLAAWSYSQTGNYRRAAEMASRAAAISAALPRSSEAAEGEAKALYLEASLRPFFGDYTGSLRVLDRAAAIQSPGTAQGLTSYTVRAAFEKGRVYYQAGQINEADRAYESVFRDFPGHELAEEAAFRRGEVMYSAGRWPEAAERFAAYRQTYPGGKYMDGALYFGAMAQNNLKNSDGAILLWERLIRDYPGSQYRFPGMFSLAQAYKDKHDWESSFNIYTSALAEFGSRARQAGAAEEAETLRYMMARLPEKAARLHVLLNRENGVSTQAGRAAALELARFYIIESSQREAGAALADEVIALKAQAPGAAAEAYILKGDYLASLDMWQQAAEAYMAGASAAADAPPDQKSTEGRLVRADLAPEALFKAASAQLRLGFRDRALEINGTLQRLYASTSWAGQGRRLLGDS
ncbi:tetratricopeptide repeat protein [Treponema sp. OttesenSCG-928-L16]|nr:tetratricopeptide repeat protein [Treponema sp. OttesenSCG-928-L16]